MKIILTSFIALFFINITKAQNVGIGTSTPQASAQLDVSSTTKGLLPPRMTSVQRDAIPGPVAGLQIWCIDCKQMQVYDGNVWRTAGAVPVNYPVVWICCNPWMTKNLEVSTYRNGDPIPKVTNGAAWASLTTGAYCYYNNDSTTYAATYGKLYNWYAVNDPRGLAPEGWHIPTDFEWTTKDETMYSFGKRLPGCKFIGNHILRGKWQLHQYSFYRQAPDLYI